MNKITHVQLFDYKEEFETADGSESIHRYSTNIIINDDFVIQSSSKGAISMPDSGECSWKDEARQDHAFENIDLDEVIEQIGIDGYGNDREWLIDNHAPEIMNPENVPG